MKKQTLKIGVASAVAFAALSLYAADYSATLTSLGPVAHWKLNEPTQPVVPTYPLTNSGSAGTALNGTYYGVPALNVPGAVSGDSAAAFNGSYQYIQTPLNPDLNPTGPFTVEFWANLTNDTAGAKSGVVSRYITVAGGPTAQLGYLFFVNNGNTSWQFRVYNGSGNTTITDTSIADVQPNTWYHVVGVYDGANITIYVNGQPTSTTTGTVVYRANTNAPTRIGAGTPEAAPTLFFPGYLDNVAIYHTALGAAQVAAHFDAATTNAAGYSAQILADNPKVYYPLNEPTLPPYVPYPAVNSGTLGAALNGTYSLLNTTSGVAEPLPNQFAGFTDANRSAAFNNGRIDFPPVPNMVTDHATITCWVKRNGSQVDTCPMFFHEAASGSAGLNFQNTTRNLAYHWEDGSTTHWSWTSGLLVPDDVWTFVALVITPTNGIMYMGSTNGLTSRTNVSAHAVHDFSQTPGMLARQPSRTDRYLKGGLDEVALFDRALDHATVSNLFYSATPAVPLLARTPANPLYEGMTVTFTAYGVGNVPVTYQWRKNGGNLSGKTASTLVLSNVGTTDSGNYDVIVTGGALSVTSAVSPITIAAGPPIIAQQPASQTRYQGAAVTFSTVIQGSVPWKFQWKKGGSDILGATASSFTIPMVSLADAGNYTVTVSNPYGTNTSSAATLTVLTVTNYANTTMSGPPLAYWRMGELTGTTAYDYAGGFNGTLNNGVTNGVPGPQPPTFLGFESTNTAFGFNGANTFVSTLPLNYTGNSATLVAWVRRDGPQVGTAHILSHRNGTGQTIGLHVEETGAVLRYTWADAAGTYSWNSGLTLPDSTWAFVALVVEPSGATMYLDDGVNGLQSARHTFNEAVVTLAGNFQVGRDARGDRYWNGAIDEVAFYGYSLATDEVANLRLMGVSGPTAPNIIAQPISRTVLVGQGASFSVGALGGTPLSYQWKHAGTNLPGATTRTLTIPSAYYTDAGSYQATVANAVGSVSSGSASLVVEAPSSFANLTNGLVLHLRFDGNYADSSGRTNVALPMGTPVFVPGKIGNQAVQLTSDSTNFIYNWVQLWDTNANAAYPDFAFTETDSFSVAFWVKYLDVEGDLPIIGNVINSTYNRGWVFAENFGGKLVWTAHADVGAVDADGIGPVIKDGTWHHVVTAFDRATATATTYIDGAQVDVRSIQGLGNLDTGYAVCLGQDPGGNYGYDGSYTIDDVGIWRRALTAGQATGIYAAGQIGQSFDVTGPSRLTLRSSGGSLELIWQQGTLQSTDNLGGLWQPVPGAQAPYHLVAPSGAGKFYRVKY